MKAKQAQTLLDLLDKHGGELGIRTPDTLVAYTRLAGEHLRPLGQLSETIEMHLGIISLE